MKNDESNFKSWAIDHYVRSQAEPWITALLAGICAVIAYSARDYSSIVSMMLFITALSWSCAVVGILAIRDRYKQEPYCGHCGVDIVDCMVNRGSWDDHK